MTFVRSLAFVRSFRVETWERKKRQALSHHTSESCRAAGAPVWNLKACGRDQCAFVDGRRCRGCQGMVVPFRERQPKAPPPPPPPDRETRRFPTGDASGSLGESTSGTSSVSPLAGGTGGGTTESCQGASPWTPGKEEEREPKEHGEAPRLAEPVQMGPREFVHDALIHGGFVPAPFLPTTGVGAVAAARQARAEDKEQFCGGGPSPSDCPKRRCEGQCAAEILSRAGIWCQCPRQCACPFGHAFSCCCERHGGEADGGGAGGTSQVQAPLLDPVAPPPPCCHCCRQGDRRLSGRCLLQRLRRHAPFMVRGAGRFHLLGGRGLRVHPLRAGCRGRLESRYGLPARGLP